MLEKRILVLGTTGTLGSYLLINLSKNYNNVYSYNRKKDGPLNETLLYKVLKSKKISFIINCIAQTDVNYCEQYPQNAIQDNVVTSLVILNAVNKINNKIKIIHISTDQFYDNNVKSSERNNIKLLNNYAITKLISEKIFNINLNTIILRTNFFYDKSSGLIKFIYKNLNKNKKIHLYENVYFTPVHISTVFLAITRVIENFDTGIYNLGCLDKISKYDFGSKIISLYNLNYKSNVKKIKYNDKFVKRPLNMSMSSLKFKRKFNFKISTIDSEISKINL